MADPLSIIAVVMGLVGTAMKTLKTINDMKSRYKNAELTIASMEAQCACVNMALSQVQGVIVDKPESTYQLRTDLDLAQTFDSVFGACHLAFMILNEKLVVLVGEGLNDDSQLGLASRARNVWNEQEMHSLLQNIQGQVSGLTVILSALHLRSKADMHTLLQKPNSKDILQRVAADVSSLVLSRPESKIAAPPSVYSGLDSIEFDFDEELVNTAAYRRVLTANVSRSNETPAPEEQKVSPFTRFRDSYMLTGHDAADLPAGEISGAGLQPLGRVDEEVEEYVKEDKPEN